MDDFGHAPPLRARGKVLALITVRLSLLRFHSERWWEKKLETYLDIIDALHHSKRYFGRLLSEIEVGRPLGDEFKTQLAENHMAASERLEKITDMGFFLVSPSAWAVLDELKKGPSNDLPDGDLHRFFSDEHKAVSNALEKLDDTYIKAYVVYYDNDICYQSQKSAL